MSEATKQTGRRKRFTVDALFADTSARGAGVSELVEAKLIRLNRIEPDPNQPRKEFDPDSLEDLAVSICSEGILQPIAVRYDVERDVYVIVHGERRWRAARMAGLESIPAIVRDVPEHRRLLQQLVENIVREDLNALDRAAALRALKTQMGDASWDQVAEAVGIRRSRLFQLLGTEKLEESVKEALRRGIVSEKQTRAVQSLPEEAQRDIGTALLDGTLEPRKMEEVVQDLQGGAKALRNSDGKGGSPAQIKTLRRQARALSTTLADLDPAAMSLLDEGLIAELEVAQERLAEVLRAARS